MKTIKFIFVILIIALSSTMFSCDTDPSIEKGNYLFVDNNLFLINGTPIQWSDDASDEVKETVMKMLGDMVEVEGGTLWMGTDDPTCPAEEMPAHTAILSSYYLSKTTVTQKQWTVIMGENPLWNESYGKGDDYPANFVSYDQAKQFIAMLNRYSGLKFRLPTEAEWEYAACGGNNPQGCVYSGSNYADLVAWHRGNADGKMHPVATLIPNKIGWHDKGMYDMSGNVWEWCSDWYGSYSANSATNPTGPATGTKRVVRGGSFTYDAEYARCKSRNCLTPSNQSVAVGLRLAMDAN